MLWSVWRKDQGGRISAAIASGAAVLAAILTTLVFIIDCIFTAIAKSKIHKATQGKAYVKFGNAEWITLIAAILLWIATGGACSWIVFRRR